LFIVVLAPRLGADEARPEQPFQNLPRARFQLDLPVVSTAMRCARRAGGGKCGGKRGGTCVARVAYATAAGSAGPCRLRILVSCPNSDPAGGSFVPVDLCRGAPSHWTGRRSIRSWIRAISANRRTTERRR